MLEKVTIALLSKIYSEIIDLGGQFKIPIQIEQASIYTGINSDKTKSLNNLNKILKIKMISKIAPIIQKNLKKKYKKNQEDSPVKVDIRSHNLEVTVLLKKISSTPLEWDLPKEVHQKIKETVSKK